VWLARGRHEFRRTGGGGRTAIFLADASAKGFSPLFDESEKLATEFGTQTGEKEQELQ
jgi:hypothetical protein